MLRSMTGFGAGSARSAEFAVHVEARSVNHRFLQVKTRLPHELSDLEPEVEARLRKKLERGAVTVNVRLEVREGAREVELDRTLLKRFRARLDELAKELGRDVEDELALSDFAALPGVLVERAPEPSTETAGKLVLRAVDAALKELVAMREHEGEALAADLAKHADQLEKLGAKVARRVPQAVAALQAALGERVAKLLGDGAALSAADLAREVALIADRGDVSEELARLRSHLGQLRSFLEAKRPVGRKLDFLVQELHREVNTIGSKANDAALAHLVVDAKTVVERLREQVQNVE